MIPARCRRTADEMLYRRARPEDYAFVIGIRRWYRGLQDATIPTSRFRDYYRELVDLVGEEQAKNGARLLWPDGIGLMPPPTPPPSGEGSQP